MLRFRCKTLQEKRLWRRYIYLWIYYAVFEELEAKDMERARDVYNACLGLIPHKEYVSGFALWILQPGTAFFIF